MTDRSVLDALDAMIANFARRDPAGPSDVDVFDVFDGPTEGTHTATHQSDSTQKNGMLARVVSPLASVENVENVENLSNKINQTASRELLAREIRWHIEHGERVPLDLCAGCRRPFGPAEVAIELADGNRVHLADGYDCLIRHGDRWRRAARAAVGQTAGAVPFSPVTTMP